MGRALSRSAAPANRLSRSCGRRRGPPGRSSCRLRDVGQERADGLLRTFPVEAQIAEPLAARVLRGLVGGASALLDAASGRANGARFCLRAGKQCGDQCPGSQSTGKRDKRRFGQRVRYSLASAVGFDALWREPCRGWSSGPSFYSLRFILLRGRLAGPALLSFLFAGVEHRPGEIHERLAGEKHGDRRHDPSCAPTAEP